MSQNILVHLTMLSSEWDTMGRINVDNSLSDVSAHDHNTVGN